MENSMWEFNEAVESVKISREDNESIVENRNGSTLDIEKFGPLKQYIKDTTITDIDYNGTDIWLTNIQNEHWKETDIKLDNQFVQRFVQNVANSESKEFNQKNAFLEVETDDLRISIIHKSIAMTGTSFCIRKTPKVERIKEKYAIETKYTNKEVLCLLANCVKAHMNIIICGEPRAGKTELAKFVSGYIPDSERVITIEDVLEWHYKALRPTADVIEMKMNKDYDYSDGIIASLKQNPKWIMIAETRGAEIKHLIQSFTTGVNGITTLHTDDVRKIPERMVNMAEDASNAERMENTIFSFIDVGVLVSLKLDENGKQYRAIDQIAFFANENGVHQTNVVLEDGAFYRNSMPASIEHKFKREKIEHPLKNENVLNKLKAQGFDINSTSDLSNKLTYKADKNITGNNTPVKPDTPEIKENIFWNN